MNSYMITKTISYILSHVFHLASQIVKASMTKAKQFKRKKNILYICSQLVIFNPFPQCWTTFQRGNKRYKKCSHVRFSCSKDTQ